MQIFGNNLRFFYNISANQLNIKQLTNTSDNFAPNYLIHMQLQYNLEVFCLQLFTLPALLPVGPTFEAGGKLSDN